MISAIVQFIGNTHTNTTLTSLAALLGEKFDTVNLIDEQTRLSINTNGTITRIELKVGYSTLEEAETFAKFIHSLINQGIFLPDSQVVSTTTFLKDL